VNPWLLFLDPESIWRYKFFAQMQRQEKMAFPPDITSATDEEILKSMQEHIHVRREGGLAHDDELYKHSMNVLEIRSMRRTAKATRRLVWATWGLVLATILLLLATILSIMNAPVAAP
jgi:hypothetical protein